MNIFEDPTPENIKERWAKWAKKQNEKLFNPPKYTYPNQKN